MKLFCGQKYHGREEAGRERLKSGVAFFVKCETEICCTLVSNPVLKKLNVLE